MGRVFDFKQAQADRYVTPSYVTPEAIEVPESVKETVADHRAKRRRELMHVATKLIDSKDIPTGSELDEREVLPKFDYPSTEKKQ